MNVAKIFLFACMGLQLLIYPVSAQKTVQGESKNVTLQVILDFSNSGDVALRVKECKIDCDEPKEIARLLSYWYSTIMHASRDPFVSAMLTSQIQTILLKPNFESKDDVRKAEDEFSFRLLKKIDDDKIKSSIRLDLLQLPENTRKLVFYKRGEIKEPVLILSWFVIMKYAFQNYNVDDIRFIRKTMSETVDSIQKATKKTSDENAQEPSVENVIQDSQRRQLCGEFDADSGIYERLVFGDKNSAIIHASGLEFPTTYFIIGNIAYINTDKGFLKLLIESPTLLIGNDTWTKDNSYSRENAPRKSCLPYTLSSSEKADLAHQICQMAAIELQGKGKLKEAAEKYLQCCNSGDPVSCNKYGLLKNMLWNDQKTALIYYEKACSMGYGGGCSNLATYEKRKGNLKKAKKLYEKACSMGFKRACLEAAFFRGEKIVKDAPLYRISVNQKFGYIDRTGKIVIEPKFENGGGFQEGLARVKLYGKWGFIDKAGKVVVKPAAYDCCCDFQEGLARINLSGKWGFIDRTGKIVIEPKFDDSGFFQEDLARVKLSGKWGFIDKAGKVVVKPAYDFCCDFRKGLASVKINGKWAKIDRTGKIVIEPKFENGGFFQEGLASIKLSGKWGFIDRTGKIVIEPKFDDSGDFQEGLANIKLSGKWGFIDRTGKIVIEPKFDDSGFFQEDLARVKLYGKWGFIDRTGKIVIKPQYIRASNFSEGLATIKRFSKCGLIDKTGKIVVKPAYYDIGAFQEGIADVWIGGKSGYIDRTGKYIWEPTR